MKAQSLRHDQSLIFVSLGLLVSVDSLSLFSCFAHMGLVGDAVISLSEFLNTKTKNGQTLFSPVLKHASSCSSYLHHLILTIFFPSPAHLIQFHLRPRYTKPIHYPIQMSRVIHRRSINGRVLLATTMTFLV